MTVYMEDQDARSLFINETGQNFSVIAPAGVGKTSAIVDRITQIALNDAFLSHSVLPRLVVVTYTNKAAQEMHLRAQAKIKEKAPHSLKNFNKAFFGTLHSFCFNFLQEHASILHLGSNLEIIEDDTSLWNDFLLSLNSWEEFLPSLHFQTISEYLVLADYIQLARNFPLQFEPSLCTQKIVHPDTASILNFSPDKRNQKNIQEGKLIIENWLTAKDAKRYPLGFPKYTKGGQAFQEVWEGAFSTLKKDLSLSLWYFLFNIAKKYQAFRIQNQKLTYDDIIYYANALLKNQNGKHLTNGNAIVILDEAQDTDEFQFSFLTNLVGLNKENSNSLLSNRGQFCMVGDSQQAIYSHRASVQFYQKLHSQLTEKREVTEITFNVTMRCNKSIVDTINTLFPPLLRPEKLGQVAFVPLKERPYAPLGLVQKWTFTPPTYSIQDPIQAEAKALAKHLNKDALNIQTWDQVGLLAPRKQWLDTLSLALKEENIPHQIHSSQKTLSDSPVYAWITALFTVMERPTDSFELAGLLRELYGVSDACLGLYTKNFPQSLHILFPIATACEVGQILAYLCALRKDIQHLSLRNTLEHLLEKTDLFARVHSLPGANPDDIENVFANIRLECTKSQIEGLHLASFAKKLRSKLYTNIEPPSPLKDHIQLYTSHKAKGLEFDVVILPYLFRKISSPCLSYPRFLNTNQAPRLVLDASDITQEDKSWEEDHSLAQLERLLYVSFTRAKHQLILVDDSSLFNLSSPSFASLSKLNEQAFWQTLSNTTLQI